MQVTDSYPKSQQVAWMYRTSPTDVTAYVKSLAQKYSINYKEETGQTAVARKTFRPSSPRLRLNPTDTQPTTQLPKPGDHGTLHLTAKLPSAYKASTASRVDLSAAKLHTPASGQRYGAFLFCLQLGQQSPSMWSTISESVFSLFYSCI